MSSAQDVVEFLPSERGKKVLINNNFRFNLKRCNKSTGVSMWYCASASKTGCHARLSTKNDLFENRSGIHNHASEENTIKSLKLMDRVKQRVLKEITIPAKRIFDEEIAEVSVEGEGGLPQFSNCCKTVYKARKKDMTKLPNTIEDAEVSEKCGKMKNSKRDFSLVDDGEGLDSLLKMYIAKGNKGSSFVIKKILWNVIKYCEKEAEKGEVSTEKGEVSTEKAAEMTGVSVHILEKIRREARDELNSHFTSSNETEEMQTKSPEEIPEVVHTPEPSLLKLNPTTLLTSAPGPSTLMEQDSFMLEKDVHSAMTCEVYPADEPQPDSLIKIKEEFIVPELYKQENHSSVKQELGHFSQEPSSSSNQNGSLFQPPVLVKEEPVSFEEEL